MKGVVVVAAAVACGLATGLGIGLTLNRAQEPNRPSSPAKTATQVAPPPARPLPILASHDHNRAAPAPSSRNDPELATSGDELSPEESGRRWQQVYRGKIAAIEAEARDPDWAPPTERRFAREFAESAESLGTELLGLECRSTGCLARVGWPSFTAARGNFKNLLHHNYEVNCATSIDIGQTPADMTVRVEATLVLDCETARIEQLEAGR